MDLNSYQQELLARKPVKGIHSLDHAMAKEVCDYFGSNKEFGLWVKTSKKIGAGELRAKLTYVKERGIKNPKYLLATCRKK